MTVASMVKITVTAPRSGREELVEELHGLGAVHLVDLASTLREDEEAGGLTQAYEADTRKLQLDLSRTEFLIEILERFEEKKKGLVTSMIKERVHVDYRDFQRVSGEIDLETVYRRAEELDVELRHQDARIAELRRELDGLAPWEELDYPLGELREFTRVETRFIIINPLSLPAWEEEMEGRCPYSAWVEVSRQAERAFLLVLLHKECLEEFNSLGQSYNAEAVYFKDRTRKVSEEMGSLESGIAEEEEKKKNIEDEIREYLPLKTAILTLNDYLYNQLLKEEAKENFAHTERAFVLEGWIERGREDEVQKEIESLGEEMDVSFGEPEDGDMPPTLLRNRRAVLPAESLIRLFGLPGYTETDPTWIMAPFFVFFFGLCMGDVGYGAIIALAFWYMLRKLDVSDNVRRFFRLFMYCGFATIIGGILTRSYFGIFATEPERFPRFLQFKFTFDPLYNPLPYMAFCAALGLLHISIGVAIEMRDNMRHNSPWIGFCEQGTTLIFWLGVAVLGVRLAIKSSVLLWAGLLIMAAGAVGIIFLSNISAKSILGKFFGGLYNLYGILGATMGDVASYLRLYALGLATVAIGAVVNILGAKTLGIPGLGIITLVLILIVGHSLNLVINFLGAFVHPLRLQYVEFFGKFYEDGGVLFNPLALNARKTVIERK
jgi:V/A-type H+-transporting ATPase subunit I